MPRRALVTGVGGFIGSHLAEELCCQGWSVRGVDCFTPYYDPAIKWRNLAVLREHDDLMVLVSNTVLNLAHTNHMREALHSRRMSMGRK